MDIVAYDLHANAFTGGQIRHSLLTIGIECMLSLCLTADGIAAAVHREHANNAKFLLLALGV